MGILQGAGTGAAIGSVIPGIGTAAGAIAGGVIGLDNYRDWETDRKSTRLNSSHSAKSRMPSSA